MLYVVALSAALSAGLLVYGLLAVLPSQERTVKARMVELGLQPDRNARSQSRSLSRIEDLARLAGEQVVSMRSGWGPLRERLIHAGYRDASAVPIYLGIRLAAATGLFAFGTAFGALVDFSPGFTILMGAWGALSGWFVPSFLLSQRITRRQKAIQKALPDALDLLVICVEAGLGLNQALLRVAAEMRHVDPLLTGEIAQTNLEIRAGTPRDVALRGMAARTGVPDVQSLATMLIQTERFGTSIARSLRVHADTLRTKRRQRAEEAAAKTTIKMVFPLALCIFPALFVVVLGPALIQIFNTLSGL